MTQPDTPICIDIMDLLLLDWNGPSPYAWINNPAIHLNCPLQSPSNPSWRGRFSERIMDYELGFWVLLVAFLALFIFTCFSDYRAFWRGYYAALDRCIDEAETVLAEKLRKQKNSWQRQIQNLYRAGHHGDGRPLDRKHPEPGSASRHECLSGSQKVPWRWSRPMHVLHGGGKSRHNLLHRAERKEQIDQLICLDRPIPAFSWAILCENGLYWLMQGPPNRLQLQQKPTYPQTPSSYRKKISFDSVFWTDFRI